MKVAINKFRGRMSALNNDERGMEAAQVILILALVVIVMIPVFNAIMNAMSSQGTKAATCIATPTGCK
jgi:Flp pilus assembly pilin Flp